LSDIPNAEMSDKTDGESTNTRTAHSLSKEMDELLDSCLLRVTDGLPNRELKAIQSEFSQVEQLLQQDIDLLEKALGSSKKDTLSDEENQTIDALLSSELSTADQFYTISALLGRMRGPIAMPLPPNSTLAVGTTLLQDDSKEIEIQKALLELDKNPEYRRVQSNTTDLIALWKKVSTHKSAAVFRRPVNPKEAPGYTDRILFPIDLSLIRKMIVARVIVSYADFHDRIGLICHNCLSYNGRESDYGVVTREFEEYSDRCVIAAVAEASEKTSSGGGRVMEVIPADDQKPPPADDTAKASAES
jgi:hypothetical protein